MVPAALAQHPLPHANRVNIHHLEGTMAVGGAEGLGQGQGMMVGGHVAKIEADKADARRPIGQQLDVAGDHPQMLRIPSRYCLILRHFKRNVAELDQFRR